MLPSSSSCSVAERQQDSAADAVGPGTGREPWRDALFVGQPRRQHLPAASSRDPVLPLQYRRLRQAHWFCAAGCYRGK
jgi:hypothetical protein